MEANVKTGSLMIGEIGHQAVAWMVLSLNPIQSDWSKAAPEPYSESEIGEECDQGDHVGKRQRLDWC